MTFDSHHGERRNTTVHPVGRRHRLVLAALVLLGGVLVDVSSSGDNSSGAATPSKAPLSVADRLVETPPPVCPPDTAPKCLTWSPHDTWAGHGPVVALLNFHPQGQPSGVSASAAWIRTAATDLGLYLGYEGPGVTSLPRGPEEVPLTGRSRLLATFNSGFYEKDGPGGFYTNHTSYFPLIKGLATVVRYTNGTVGITSWQGGATPGPTVEMARQNLSLLVNNSVPTPLSADNGAWGLTLHGAPAVWRSALGIDKAGNLIYAAAPNQTSASMASVMVQLHCVRAMELDINPEWPIFVTYGGPGATAPTLDVPNPNQIPDRFLYTSTKDFFAVFLSRAPGEAAPW